MGEFSLTAPKADEHQQQHQHQQVTDYWSYLMPAGPQGNILTTETTKNKN